MTKELPITLQVISRDWRRDCFNVRAFKAKDVSDNARIRRAAELEVVQRNGGKRFVDTYVRAL